MRFAGQHNVISMPEPQKLHNILKNNFEKKQMPAHLRAVGGYKFCLECFLRATFSFCSFQHLFVPCFTLFYRRRSYICQQKTVNCV